MQMNKIFTLAEANKRLPLVRKIVSDIHTKAERFRSLVAHLKSGPPPNEALELQAEIEGLLGEIEDLGCFYKDWNFKIGLVDFPAIIDGDAVLLCWRSDEPEIRWYPGFEDGYPGRKKIPDELLK